MMNHTWGEEYRPPLLRQAYRLARNVADAQDLVQDTLVRAYERREQQRDESATLPWLRAILQNLFCNRCVREKRRGIPFQLPIDSLSDKGNELRSSSSGGDPQSALLHGALRDMVMESVRRMPAKYRDCLVLSDITGCSYQQIAERLGISLAVVKSRLHRARVRVREQLIAQGFDN